ncbi:MAG: glycogen synthase, partial [Shewanella sp.]
MTGILMVATENAALAGAKVGGMADVIRDLPEALAPLGLQADVIMPNYGFLQPAQSPVCPLGEFEVAFGGKLERLSLGVIDHPRLKGAKIYLLEHGLWHTRPGQMYSQGSSERPFAEDATKFALFSLGVAKALVAGLMPLPKVVHLHDWHVALFAMLRAFAPEFAALKALGCVYSIHNLAYQGVRPLRHDPSSLAAWFPSLTDALTAQQLGCIIDPRYPHCINPMRMGIVLSDKVHLVSPSYAKEVLMPSDPARGFIGGEGLEQDLRARAKEGCLFGILNGCQLTTEEAADKPLTRKPFTCSDSANADVKADVKTKAKAYAQGRLQLPEFTELLAMMEQALATWQGRQVQVNAVDMLAFIRLQRLWRDAREGQVPELILTSVGRLTSQKVLILCQRLPSGLLVLETLLQRLLQSHPRGIFILLGSGDPAIAEVFQGVAANYRNFIFLQGCHEALSERLYQWGDLFIMPSSFEPCGISQMLAMGAG